MTPLQRARHAERKAAEKRELRRKNRESYNARKRASYRRRKNLPTLSEAEVQDRLRPHTGLLVLAGAVGLSADFSRRLEQKLAATKFLEVRHD